MKIKLTLKEVKNALLLLRAFREKRLPLGSFIFPFVYNRKDVINFELTIKLVSNMYPSGYKKSYPGYEVGIQINDKPYIKCTYSSPEKAVDSLIDYLDDRDLDLE